MSTLKCSWCGMFQAAIRDDKIIELPEEPDFVCVTCVNAFNRGIDAALEQIVELPLKVIIAHVVGLKKPLPTKRVK